MKFIYQGTSFFQRGRRVQLKDLQYIFDCPECEYVMTALAEEGIESIRDMHVRICHPELLVGMRFDDYFGGIND